MPPFILNLFRNCFQRPVGNGSIEAIWKLNKKVQGEFNFVVPRKEFERFTVMKPENGSILTVGQYMFLYNYIIGSRCCKEPGPDFERVYYYFWDKLSIYKLKGWVPTVKDVKKEHIPERTLLTNLNTKVHMLKSNDKSPVYINEKSARVNEIQSQGILCDPKIEPNVESRTAPQEIFPGPPRMKSTYNWGVINTWSRHMAPRSEDDDPVNIYDRFKPAALPSGSNINLLARLDRDINNAIEGKSRNKEHESKVPKKSDGMVVSTLDTRVRRVRPRAAKEPRTRPVLSYYNR